jgi:F-type H+-transporting ATPase subunit b
VLIDWFTVAAQGINFLILVLVLKKFLYGPITRAMAAREEKIAGRLAEAATARAEARREFAALETERARLEADKQRLLAEAREEVGQWRESALAAARQAVDDSRRQWLAGLAAERETLSRRLRCRVAEEVVALGRRAFRDLADKDFEARVVSTFLAKVRSAGGDLPPEAAAGGSSLVVETGFAAENGTRRQLVDGLAALFPKAGAAEIALTPELGFGLRLTLGQWQVEWNLDWYLREFEAALGETLVSHQGIGSDER